MWLDDLFSKTGSSLAYMASGGNVPPASELSRSYTPERYTSAVSNEKDISQAKALAISKGLPSEQDVNTSVLWGAYSSAKTNPSVQISKDISGVPNTPSYHEASTSQVNTKGDAYSTPQGAAVSGEPAKAGGIDISSYIPIALLLIGAIVIVVILKR